MMKCFYNKQKRFRFSQYVFKYFYSEEIRIKGCVKITKKWKNNKFSKKDFFMNFQDMIIWFGLGENTYLGSVSKKISYSQNPYCRKAPSFCPHRRKKAFLKEFFSFKPNFHMLGQQVLTKFFTWQESPYFILQNLNFDFFISCVVLDKFEILGTLTYNPDFEITTFIFTISYHKARQFLHKNQNFNTIHWS